MKRIFFSLLTLALMMTAAQGLKAQTHNDPVIMEVNGKPIYKSEFMKDFLVSIGQDPAAAPTACTYEKRKALEDYVELYANFRAKLTDAYTQRFDTLHSIKKELNGYRNELAAPYLIDSASMDRILREAYDRNHYAVHASHILIKCDQNASPADTMTAYTRAMEVYQKAIKGENFDTLAVVFSEDPSARGMIGNPNAQGNHGDLGCFTVFNMVYPFENASFNTPAGQISKPVRSSFGYHIVKVHARMPYFGKSSFQHIWIRGDQHNGQAAQLAKAAYEELKDGADFARVVKNYSDDRSTMGNGGMIQDMDLGQMPPEYVEQISQMNVGQFTKPFESQYGWHILYLVKKETIPAFEDMVPLYKQRLARDSRNKEPRSVFVDQCKKKYQFVDNTELYLKRKVGKTTTKEYLASLQPSVAAIDSTVFRKKWKYQEGTVADMRPLFSIGDQSYTNVDLLKYIEANQTLVRNMGDLETYVREQYKNFIADRVVAYADSRLELENPDFADLIAEYRNGLMIFAYNDKMIWHKAMKDTAGLNAFYATESNKRSLDNPADDYYFWNTRALVDVITVADSAYLSSAKAKKIIAKCQKKGINATGLLSLLRGAAKVNDTSIVAVALEPKTVEQNNQSLLKNNEWQRGLYERANKKGYTLLIVNKIIDPCLKSVKEARGYYINDYQNYLDAELLKELRKKYNVVIHQNVIDEITY